MISSCLFKRNNIYYFRLRIPYDIAPYFSRRDIWKSLKTKSNKSAKTTITKLLYHTEQLFLHVRSGMYTDPQIRQLVKDYLHSTLNRLENLRSIGLVTYMADNQQAVAIDADPKNIVDSSLKTIGDLIESNKTKLFTNDLSKISSWVELFLKENGIPANKDSVEYVTLCREILKAEIEVLKVEKERISGNYNNRYDSFLDNIIDPVVQAIAPGPVQHESAPSPVVKLSQIIQENINEADLGNNWTEKTKAENEGIYQVILEILGDVDIKTVTHQTMMKFRDKLAKLPANRDKVKLYKGKSIEQILTMRNVTPMSKSTVNKYIIRASTLFKWAVKHGYIPTNVAEGLTLPKTRRADQEREAYTTEDIQKVVSHLNYNKDYPHQYWIPLIGMYQGMRLDEICQLYVKDIVIQEETPCISVNGTDDKKLKNTASERIIPIHPMLIQLGFLDYVNGLIDKKQTRLWGKLTKKRDGFSQDFGKWYQRFNRKFVTVLPKRVFHSFRHSLTDRLKQAGVQDTLIAEILGHSNESVTMSRYGKRYQPKVLLEALIKLDYGVSMPELK